MLISPSTAYAAVSSASPTPLRRQAEVASQTSLAALSANFADAVTISQTARELLAVQAGAMPSTQAAAPAKGGNADTAAFATDQGAMDLNIDAYFTPGKSAGGSASPMQSLPPLLLPNQDNIDALTKHLSAVVPQFLAQNHIPAAPSSVTYDERGQIQLPADYAYASQFKQALADNPTIANELRTVHALASDLTEMKKAIPFQREYAAAATQAEADAVVAKYAYLFSANHHYDSIALHFAADGSLSLTDDGKPMA